MRMGFVQDAIRRLVEGQDIGYELAYRAMDEIMSGEASPAQIAGFLIALRMKGEKADEIAACAQVMREKATRVNLPDERAVDTCGTGGDGAGTFNISTIASFVVAGAGVVVAKHGNRAASSKCGSADLLEALGVRITLGPEEVECCMRETRFGFMFAPHYHKAMKHAAPVRREMGVRTIFNIVGPLSSPALVKYQLLGVFDGSVARTLAEVLKKLGAKRALIVHSRDGLDEISISAPTDAVLLEEDGQIREFVIEPTEFGLKIAEVEDIKGGDVEYNRQIAERVLEGEEGPYKDVVVLNAAAALFVAGHVSNIKEGIEAAREAIDSGKAMEVLEKLREVSRRYDSREDN